MKKNIMRKNLWQSIVRSLTRYLAIVAIIALGAGMFVGLRSTKSDMVATGQRFTDDQNMFDLRLLNTYGWGQSQLDAISQLPGIVDAEGVITLDALVRRGSGEEDMVYKLYSIPHRVNQVYLLGGRMPENPNECLADGYHATDGILGTTVTVSTRNEEATMDSLTAHTFTVVGYVSTPIYMDMNRGSTTLGNGSVASYLYLPRESFDVDYFAEIDITLPGDYAIYTSAYDDAMDAAAEDFQQTLLPLAAERYSYVRQEAENAYQDGLTEYQDGLKKFEEGRQEAMEALADAKQKLLDGQAELDRNEKLLLEGEEQLTQAQAQIDRNLPALQSGRQELAQAKATAYAQMADASSQLLENYQTVTANLKLVDDALVQLTQGLSQLDSGIQQLESGLQQLDMMLGIMDTLSGTIDPALEAAQKALEQAEALGVDEEVLAPLRERYQQLLEQRGEYDAQYAKLQADKQQYTQQLEELKQQREELLAQKAELEASRTALTDGLAAIDEGYAQLQTQRAQADRQFAEAEAELEDAMIQLENGQHQIDAKRRELEAGKLALQQGREELEQGWQDYRQGREETLMELNEAQYELTEAKASLAEARDAINAMKEPSVYALTRNTNVGYMSLANSSDIVQGVSTVFPAFFLLIAALVCITTMTRMVEEERTQIGTLKALGYRNWEIMGKYLAYSGSAAVIGCGLGVLIGSVVFPMILWQAYRIILNLTPGIVLRLDWGLCLLVVVAYTAVNLLVTWYCCRMILREEPAELIRPKPPTSGKKILLEFLPFWEKMDFLNKVMLRNVFRYRQRLLMMLMGIGGCTALLLTGFGIRDSIMDIVSFQFEEITLYDMEVHFASHRKPEDRQAFLADVEGLAEQVAFYHQSSVDLSVDADTSAITMIAADDSFLPFMDFHADGNSLPLPQQGQVLLSIGVAERMGIRKGDTVILRNSDMQELTVIVSDLYENYVQNYAIVSPETVQTQWGALPEQTVACLRVSQGKDVHQVSAHIASNEDVMRVSVCQEMAEQVGSMLQALDLVVLTVVVCAGMLAVTVLYNLTNINITERIREIATIKVLGFTAAESAAYVFKENLLLSAFGCAVGLPMGKLLLAFVMSRIRVDIVWMPPRLTLGSYLMAVVLTMLCACLVDFVLFFRLDKINMAEALKSVE